ncbi:E3 ubiquitin-protein ligase RNF14 [Elysia marginata]|uniref:RBR-type E3 ubiquitin transferase n=1 Tax=Elysia marginata TaxID=1093978 RepID=A0AAV4H181_9GAST|nr:E3 ubiquitin-protein ligase RNF14 [Elysia marginata]
MDCLSFMEDKYVENLQDQRDEVFALQEIFNTGEDEKLKVLSQVTDEKDSLYTLLIAINPKPTQGAIRVNVIVQAEVDRDEEDDEVLGAAAAVATTSKPKPPPLARDVPLCRSISGQRWQGTFEVKFLLPFNLLVTFPPTYPSSGPPSFHLSCAWLTPVQLEAVECMLHTLWSEAGNMPVVFTWVDWLENNCLEHLAIKDDLVLQSALPVGEALESDDVTSPEEDLGATIAAMTRYNQEKLNEEFCQTIHLCEVCYDEYPGTQFFRILECSHAFCHTCMQAFCEMHTIAGTVEELRCPTPKCDSILPPYIIQAVLSEEAYERWEKLLLQKTIDAMEDTVYCPRCDNVVIVEEDRESNLAHCPLCFFAFCTQCERGWHQGRSCETEEEMLENLEKQATGGNQNRALAAKLQELRRKMEEEIESKRMKKKVANKCPVCKIPVEKIGGCNKMTCKCGAIFCWICSQQIKGYDHFRTGKCDLFPGQQAPPLLAGPVRRVPDAVLRMRAMVAINPEMANNHCRCPMCKQACLKGADGNNHIKCWNCKANFCFVCNQRIIGPVTAHFTGPCKQHS